MTLCRSRLLGRELVARDTIAVRIARPNGFTFNPGQYIDLTVINPPLRDPEGPTRSLSIASAPGAAELEVLVRVRDTAFKHALARMLPGSPLVVEGPLDDLRLERADGRPLVMVAGGVGIAPFLSLLRHVAAAGRQARATLFYSNRRPEDAPYLDELSELERRIPGLKVVATMTRVRSSALGWNGETARLGIELFARHLPALVGPAYRIAGSARLVSGLCRALEGAGVPLEDIDVEMFAAY